MIALAKGSTLQRHIWMIASRRARLRRSRRLAWRSAGRFGAIWPPELARWLNFLELWLRRGAGRR
jgi:hypothetical protein